MATQNSATLDHEQQKSLFASIDTHMVGIMRCLLAAVALFATVLDARHNPTPALLVPALVVYAIYSVALCAANFRGLFTIARTQPWIDVFFYSCLIALTHGTDSIFFHFFFFAIVAAAFSQGFREGLGVTMFAVVSFVVIGLAGYAVGASLALTELASRAISLFILGYMISYWGGNELALRRGLSFLRELAACVNPHATLDGLIGQQLGRLREFFGAEACLLALPTRDGHGRLYRADVSRGSAVLPAEEISEELARPLLGLPSGLKASFDSRGEWRGAPLPRVRAWEAEKRVGNAKIEASCNELANLLETRSFACVPYVPNPETQGRLYILASSHSFSDAEITFVAHAAAQMAAAANDVMLTHQLAATAARQERSKISRDIHDTTVQSYIGLKLGLEALFRQLEGHGTAAARIKELLDMATLTVEDLRGYVNRLQERGEQRDIELLKKIDEQRRRYEAFHGISVEVRAQDSLMVNTAAGVEAYQLVCEALSNIVRHTSAKRAFVDLRRSGDTLAIEVGNDAPKNNGTPPFIPRSITERAMSLGGEVQVRLNKDGHDVVKVTIPLLAATRESQLALRA